MIVTSSHPVKERSVASHSKYILLQPSPVGEAQGPAWHSPRKWTFGVILIWRATGTMVSKERGKENKAGREGKTGRNWSCSVPPSHVLAAPPPPRQKSHSSLRTQILASPERPPEFLWLTLIPLVSVSLSLLLTFVLSQPLWLWLWVWSACVLVSAYGCSIP